jgi:transposase
MLSRSEDVEVHALAKRGWSISAIARHLDVDRKTVRVYLAGDRVPGVRRSSKPDPLAPFTAYVKARFGDDPHLWATALFDEVVALGYACSYPSFVRQVRVAGLRPHCEACSGVAGRETVEIVHPAGEEIQWDWAERRRAPWGGTCYVLLGTLSHSGRTRAVIAESMDQPHLIEAIDSVLRRLGGTARCWRTDRLATVISAGTGDVQASFAPVAKHYGVTVVACPPRRGNRKGAVECGVKFMCGRWWRTLTATTPTAAQTSLDRFWASIGDARGRPPGRYTDPAAPPAGNVADMDRPAWPTVGELADAETLLALPDMPFPATVTVTRTVDVTASVAFRGNRYSVAPGMTGAEVTVRHRLGTVTADIVADNGTILVTHTLAPPGSGITVRTPGHRQALEAAVLSQFTTGRPCDRKANRPPGTAALAERARLAGPASLEPSVDLEALAEIVRLAFPPTTPPTTPAPPAAATPTASA